MAALYTMTTVILLMLSIFSLCSAVQASCLTTARDLEESVAHVLCPSGCFDTGNSIWGTDIYTDDSSICRAAIHAGLITNDGGQVTVRKIQGQTSYSGSTRNGITSSNYGTWPESFIFLTASNSAEQASCSTTAREIQEYITDVLCPSGCLENGKSIWGTDVYTDDSSICRAAIHAGLITNDGGQVTVRKIQGQTSYTESTRNGITSNIYGNWPGSYIFLIVSNPLTRKPTGTATQVPPVQASCSTAAKDIQKSVADVQCPSGCLENGKSIWGTDVYTDDSSICRAAIHAGLITNDGEQVTVRKIQGQTSYSGSTRNGITSSNYGTWPESFIFVAASNSAVQASCSTTARDIEESIADVQCPSGCLENGKSIWGTDVYTDDSSICRAAIHAGLIANKGGKVAVRKIQGQTNYNGSTRNGITTNNYGDWPGSYIFLIASNSLANKPTGKTTQVPPVQASCSTTARDIKESVADVLCPSGCLENGKSIWGTDVYTDDSSICRAAIHAGLLTNNVGQVTVRKIQGQTSYSESTRNGITANNYGTWSGSFIFLTASNSAGGSDSTESGLDAGSGFSEGTCNTCTFSDGAALALAPFWLLCICIRGILY